MPNLDSIGASGLNQPRLAQINPPLVCPNSRLFVKLSDDAQHLKRCRCRRCSIECERAGAAKLDLCLGLHLKAVIEGGLLTSYTISHLTTKVTPLCHSRIAPFRGHLTLPPDSTPADHRQAKALFLRAINRARKKLGCLIELHANLHLTSPHEGHYDYLCYTSLPENQLREVIRAAWYGRDQGYRYALIPVSEKYLQAACKYHAKAVKTPTGEEPLMPVRKGEPGYLEATWHTRGWWAGSSLDKVWKEHWASVYPAPDSDQPQPQPDLIQVREPLGHKIARVLDTKPTLAQHDCPAMASIFSDALTGPGFPECQPTEIPPFLRELYADEPPPPTHREARFKRLAKLITPLVPSDPAKAIHSDDLAGRLGFHPALMPGILEHAPGLAVIGNRVYRHSQE